MDAQRRSQSRGGGGGRRRPITTREPYICASRPWTRPRRRPSWSSSRSRPRHPAHSQGQRHVVLIRSRLGRRGSWHQPTASQVEDASAGLFPSPRRGPPLVGGCGVWSRRRTPSVGPRALPLAVCRVSAHGRAACHLLNPKPCQPVTARLSRGRPSPSK